MSTAETDAGGRAPRYHFPPLERRGAVLGLRAGSVLVLAAGALLALAALRSVPGAGGVAAALGLVVAASMAACWPVAGAPPVAWLPTVLGWLRRRQGPTPLDAGPLAGTVARHEAAATTGTAPGAAAHLRRGGAVRHRPNPTAPPGLRLRAAPAVPGDPDVGVVEDLAARSWAAVIPVSGPELSLLGPDDQARRVASWGAVLSSLARSGSGIRRLQWLAQCTPADGAGLRAAAAATHGPTAAQAAYRDVVEAEVPGVLARRAFLVVSVHHSGGVPLRPLAPHALNDLLRREVRLLRTHLRAAELDVGEALDLPSLVESLRAANEPTRPSAAPDGRGRPGAAEERAAAGAWPAALDERWASVRVDGVWQATYWIAEWPRLPVGPDVLAPLLLASAVHAVGVTMAPVPPERAVRDVQSARTAALADEALRARAGFIDSAQRRRESEGVRQREAELADGHADYRYSGYVTVSAPSEDALAQSCAEVEQAAHQSHLVLRRLYGRQAEARTWTLPVGRGLG